MRRRAAGNGLLVLGVVLVAIAVAGAAFSGDEGGDDDVTTGAETSPTTESATATEPTTAATDTTTTETTATPVPVATQVTAFYDEFEAAVVSSDTTFLFDRLEAAVMDRYGADQCRSYVEAFVGTGSSFSLTVHSVGDTGPFDYATDGQSTPIPDAVPAELTFEQGGQRTDTTGHVRIVDGVVRWFTDCGTPQ